jgi:thiol-disulfide isomerase/thioredoxin
MNKFFSLVLALVIMAVSNSVNANDAITMVSGKMNIENARSAILFEVIEGKRVEYASTKLGSAKDFGFALPTVKEGFYYLSDQSKRRFTRIYLKQNDKLELSLTEDGYEVIKGSKENQILQEWFTKSYVITNPTYLTFFPALESFLPQVAGFKSKIKTPDKQFNYLMNMVVDLDVENAAILFLMTPKSVHPTKEQYPAYYSTIIRPDRFVSTDLLKLGDAVEYINRYMNFNFLMGKLDTKTENRLLTFSNLILNDTLKGAFIASSLRFKTYEDMEKSMAPIKKYLVTDSMQAAYFRTLKSLATFQKGSPSYNFAYEDISGKKVSMNDLKGKVVLIDVWATWCGPCKVELPHLKKLEEEYKDKDVTFVSVSVDVEKDKEKWKKMVAKDQLGGIQLFASGWSEIAKYYDITGIPRFMVFDKEGKIVSSDSPRPSQPELKTMLDETLGNK